MGQVVSCQTVSIKASVNLQTSLCGIYGGQNGSGTVLSLCNLVFLFRIILPMLHVHLAVPDVI